MDLVNAAVGLQQARINSAVQFSVAARILKSQQQQGGAALQLVDAATEGINQAGNALVAAASGLGGQLDITG